jgi:hypothetical protein
MSARSIFWGCVGLTILPLSCADCLEILEPQPSRNLSTGIALPLPLPRAHVFSKLLKCICKGHVNRIQGKKHIWYICDTSCCMLNAIWETDEVKERVLSKELNAIEFIQNLEYLYTLVLTGSNLRVKPHIFLLSATYIQFTVSEARSNSPTLRE